ncbi:MAG TPA: hypothetical protein VMT15_00260 [Bryobacteraceae bacterium]|nr:hypothetical protein [Bryobacteraceae bacterium]
MASPLRILAAAIAAAVLVIILLKTGIVPRYAVALIAVALWGSIRWWAQLSARETRARHKEELEKLRQTPVLKIDD